MQSGFKKLCSLVLLLFIVVPGVLAGPGSISGTIIELSCGKPVEGVNVYLPELSRFALSDAFGRFLFFEVPPGEYRIKVTALGFTSVFMPVRVADSGLTNISIVLGKNAVLLNDVSIDGRRDPGNNTVTGIDLKLRPINSTQDMLRMVPGLFTAQHQGGGKAEQIFLRGFDADHGTDVAVTVDGMPANMVSHAHGQGYADLHWVIPELVQQMNFGKGPYAVEKGNLATAGWVDFKTRNNLERPFLKLEGGTYGYARAVAGIDLIDTAASRRRRKDAYLAGEYAYNRGYFDRNQHFNRVNLIGKYTRQISSGQQIVVTGTGFFSKWDASGQVPERAVVEGAIGRFGEIDKESGRTSRFGFNVQYTRIIGSRSDLKMNYFLGYYDFVLYSNFTFFLVDSINGDQIRQAEKRLFTGYNSSFNNRHLLAGMEGKFTMGAGARYDATHGSELSHTKDESTVLSRLAYGDIQEMNLYAYVNETVHLLPGLVLSAGTRFDYFRHRYRNRLMDEPMIAAASTNAFSPKATLQYDFSSKVRVYIHAGIGFHSNDTRVVVPQDGRQVLPLARSMDIGTIMKPWPRMLLSAAVFRMDLDQEFVYVGDAAEVEPGGRTRRNGFDLSLRYQLLHWLFIDADFNYTHARARDEPKGQDFVPLAARLTTIGGLTIKNRGPWSASLRFRHIGDRPANEDNTVVAPGYTVFDATASYGYKRWELGMQVQNLTNTDWNEAAFDTKTRLKGEATPVTEICFTPGTPISLKLTATYSLQP